MDNLWIWLVVEVSTPLKNMSSSIGMMIILNVWENKIHVPNHQSVFFHNLRSVGFLVDTLWCHQTGLAGKSTEWRFRSLGKSLISMVRFPASHVDFLVDISWYIYIYISSRSTSNMLESCDRRSRSLNMGPNSSKKGQNCSRSFWGHFKIRG